MLFTLIEEMLRWKAPSLLRRIGFYDFYVNHLKRSRFDLILGVSLENCFLISALKREIPLFISCAFLFPSLLSFWLSLFLVKASTIIMFW